MVAVNLRSHRIAVLLVIACISFNAHALKGFSRACPLGDIPAYLKAPALILFDAISTAPKNSLTALVVLPKSKQDEYFALESLTVDYGSFRYFLFAENAVYRYYEQRNAYFFEIGYKSPGWDAFQIAPETLADSRLAIFFSNRGPTFSQRAGNPQIFERWARVPTVTYAYRDFFKVVGKHYYHDPVSKRTGYLGQSVANDCNLSEFGFENR